SGRAHLDGSRRMALTPTLSRNRERGSEAESESDRSRRERSGGTRLQLAAVDHLLRHRVGVDAVGAGLDLRAEAAEEFVAFGGIRLGDVAGRRGQVDAVLARSRDVRLLAAVGVTGVLRLGAREAEG